MGEPRPNMAQEIAEATLAYQRETTGHAPKAVTVALSADTLVVTLHEALSPAEKELAKEPEGAAQVAEYHRQLFNNSSGPLRGQIARITGVAVCEAVVEGESTAAGVAQAFTGSAIVQVFRLAGEVPSMTWHGKAPNDL